MTNAKRLPSRTASQFTRLLAMPVADAFSLACHTLHQRQIVPAGCDAVGPVSQRLLAAADAAGINDVDSLLIRQHRLLCELTGLEDLEGEHEEDVASELHILRNVLAALVAAAGLGCGATAAKVLAQVPALTCTRSWLSRRATTPDEALLLRLVAEDHADTDLGLRGTCTYVLAEASAGIGELTAVHAADIGGDSHQRTVDLPGTRRKLRGTVTLDAWGSRHVSNLLTLRLRQDRHDGSCRPLTYLGKHRPGSAQAQQSSQPILNTMRTVAGLNTADTTAGSIPLFRAEQARVADASAEQVITLLRTRTLWPDDSEKHDGGHEQACRELRVVPAELGTAKRVVTEFKKRARRATPVAA